MIRVLLEYWSQPNSRPNIEATERRTPHVLRMQRFGHAQTNVQHVQRSPCLQGLPRHFLRRLCAVPNMAAEIRLSSDRPHRGRTSHASSRRRLGFVERHPSGSRSFPDPSTVWNVIRMSCSIRISRPTGQARAVQRYGSLL